MDSLTNIDIHNHHAQFVLFWEVFLLIYLLYYSKRRRRKKTVSPPSPQKSCLNSRVQHRHIM